MENKKVEVYHTESLFTTGSDRSSRGQVVYSGGLGSTCSWDKHGGIPNLTPNPDLNPELKRARTTAAPLSH